MSNNLSLDQLPEEVKREIYAELSKEFGRRRPRATKPGLKEAKLKATADVLGSIAAFTIPQQRQILTFCIETIEAINKKYWRDNEKPVPKKGGKHGKHNNLPRSRSGGSGA